MCRVALAPCSPFSVTAELMRDTAVLARERGVLLHTHLCETRDVEDGRLLRVDEESLFHEANRISDRMLSAAERTTGQSCR